MNAKTKAERRAASRNAKPNTKRVKPIEEVYRPRAKQIELLPRNANQAEYIDLLYTEGRDIIFATGPAGTGKLPMPPSPEKAMGVQLSIDSRLMSTRK